jgi:hypothetical protein
VGTKDAHTLEIVTINAQTVTNPVKKEVTMNKLKITIEDIERAGRFYESDECLIATALKRTFPKKETGVLYDKVYIDDKVYNLPTKSVDLIAEVYDEKAVFPFTKPHYPDMLDGLTMELTPCV